MQPVTLRVAVVALLSMGTPCRTAHADASDLAAADTLFRQGRASAEAGDYAHAYTAFAESLRLDPAPGTFLNLADCEEHLGRLVSARDHFLRVESVLPVTDERRAIAHERAATLAPRIPRLTITLDAQAPPDARVFRDDIELDHSLLALPSAVDPGSHSVLVVAAGRESRSVTIVAVEREEARVVVSPGPVVPHALTSSVAPSHTVAWFVGAGSIVSFGVGTYFGARALAERSISDASCTGGACSAVGLRAYESALSDARAADVALGIGVVALAVSGYLFLTAGASGRASAAIRVDRSGLGGAW